MIRLISLFISIIFLFSCENNDSANGNDLDSNNSDCALTNNWQLDYLYYVIESESANNLNNYEYYFCAEDYTNPDFDCFNSDEGYGTGDVILSDISFYDYAQNQGGSVHFNWITYNQSGEEAASLDYDGTWIISDCEEGGEITIYWNEPISLPDSQFNITAAISYLYILELSENLLCTYL